MTARATFTHPVLPLGDIDIAPPVAVDTVEGETPSPSSSEAVGQQERHPDYLRLFGNHPPEQVIGIPSPVQRDPALAAECHFSDALHDVGCLRSLHFAKGFTLDHDLKRGSAWFWHGVHEFWWRAQDAVKNPAKCRRHKIAAAALLIASIEADDFQAQQESRNEA